MDEISGHIKQIIAKRYAKVVYVKKTGTSYLFRSADTALIVKESSTYFPPKQEVQRRIDSSKNAREVLGPMVCETHQSLIVNEKISLLVKETPWVRHLKQLNDYPLSSICANFLITSDIKKLYRFTLKSFLTTGKVYDFLGRFSTKNPIIKLIISDNIFVQDKNMDHLYLDADWYFKMSDTSITSFPLPSYYKRTAIALATYACGYMFFLIAPFIYRLIDIRKTFE